MYSKSENLRSEWKSIALLLGLTLAVFAWLYLILPPSILLPLATFVIGLIVAVLFIRAGCLGWQTACLSLVLMTAVLSTLIFLLSRPVSTGTVAAGPAAWEIDTLLQGKSFSGVVLIAQNDLILVRKAYGYADRSRMIPNTLDTRFRLGSVSKQFTAMAILMLQARGKLNVQDRICRHLADCPTAWEDITIHHLLTHSSGMVDYLAQCFSSAGQVQQTMLQARSQPLAFEPGARAAYSNVGYRVLAEIVERVSGDRYSPFLQKNIFGPLQMTRTAFETTETPGLAVGYTDKFLPACPMDMSFEYGEGGINSTVEDLYRWDQALNSEKLIPQPLLESMFTAYIPADDQMGITGGVGYGWGVGRQSGHPVSLHGGFIQGFTSVIARFPDDRLTLIMLSNQQNYGESIYRLLAGKLLAQE
jgi:CubicO group peptidase (beta-lactamase class C family)